jgi:hypothetical protein
MSQMVEDMGKLELTLALQNLKLKEIYLTFLRSQKTHERTTTVVYGRSKTS